MNITGIFGFLAAVALIVYGMVAKGDPLTLFRDYQSMAIVFGGTLGALIMAYPFKVIKTIPKMLWMTIKPKKYNPRYYIDQMVEYAKIARTKSLLALEDSANDCKDPFMKSSLMLIVDANDSDRVKSMLDDAIDFMTERHEQNVSVFDKGSALAPAFGMLGTLIGLIIMLAHLSDDADSLGAGMSVALITTFYGSIFSNLICAPISTRLKGIHKEEVLCMQIVEEGAIAIISGANPRYIQEKLEFMLPDKDKSDKKTKAKAVNK